MRHPTDSLQSFMTSSWGLACFMKTFSRLSSVCSKCTKCIGMSCAPGVCGLMSVPAACHAHQV